MENLVHAIAEKIQDPTALVLLLVLGVVSWFTERALNRQRRALQNFGWLMLSKLEDCEDGHLARDVLQLDSVALVEKCVSVLETAPGVNPSTLSEIKAEARTIRLGLSEIKNRTLSARKESRDLRKDSELFGQGSVFDRRKRVRNA